MNQFKYKIAQFMQGRYGVDQLYRALNFTIIGLLILNLFLQSTIISVIFWVVFIISYYRVLSKNILKRQSENSRYLSILYQAQKKLRLPIRRIKEIRTHRYRKCPKCKQVMRLKRKSGKHSVVCPNCQNKMTVRIM